MWFTWYFWKLSRSIKSKRLKCTSPSWFSIFSHWLLYGWKILSCWKWIGGPQFNSIWNGRDPRSELDHHPRAIYEENFHILRDCEQLLFANQQLNFNFGTVSFLLSVIHDSGKRYRSALFAFDMNSLNSIPVLLKGHLPMSIIPMESLLGIIDSSVSGSQKPKIA